MDNFGKLMSSAVSAVTASLSCVHVASYAALIGTAVAAEYSITVETGSTDLASAMKSAYPNSILVAGDTVVKKGTGMLTDTATALALDSSLEFIVEEGELYEGVARIGCTYTVKSGASVVVGVDLKNIAPKDHNVVFNLAGSGTSAHPGALSIEAYSSANNQYITYNLLDDATIYTTQSSVNLSASSGSAVHNNKFMMGGHTLTFKASSTDSYFRLRYAATFVDPGPIVLDCVGLTKQSGKKVNCSGMSDRIPLVKLVNGARLNCVDSLFADKIAEVECEYGTKICKVYDTPTDYTLAKVTGCPEISSDQTVTIGNLLTARLSDLEAGHCLKANGTLAFAEGGIVVSVDGFLDMTPGTDYTIVSSDAISGGAALCPDCGDISLLASSTAVTATFNGDASKYEGGFVVNVPYGSTYNWVMATNGLDAADIAGKTLYKVGGGTLAPDGDVAATGLTNLVVAGGVYAISAANELPVNSGKGKHVKVLKGATLKFNRVLHGIGTEGSYFYLDVAGRGFVDAGGALVFAETGSANPQYAVFTLSDDATFFFTEKGTYYFSSTSGTARKTGIFNLDGNSLTFKGADGVAATVFFRYAASFNNPGCIVFDNVTAAHKIPDADGDPSYVYVNGEKDTASLPVVLRNGATLKHLDNYIVREFSCIDCESGTEIVNTNHFRCVKIVGCPSITGDATKPVTISGGLAVRTADILAGNALSTVGPLVFGNDSIIEFDGAIDPAILPEGGCVIAYAGGGISGKPSSSSLKELGLRLRSGIYEGMDALFVERRRGLVMRIR